jgi:GDPmannose 4,6-dehydratase
MFAVNGILFNHESPRRPETFVTSKIVTALVRISNDEQDCLYLGNLNASRDWGHARDYVYGMWKMLQVDRPDDYVLATGKTKTVREFIEIVIEQLGLSIDWQGRGLEEIGYCPELSRTVVKVDQNYFRPSEVDYLHGDYRKAKQELDWEPKTSLNDLIAEMICAARNANKS